MKRLKFSLFLIIPLLLSGCYTQLQYQKTAEQEYRSERRTADNAVREVRSQNREYAESRVGLRGNQRAYYPYYFQDDYMYGGYYPWGSGNLGYVNHINWNHSYYRFYTGYRPYFGGRQWGSYFRYRHMPYSGPWFSITFGTGRYHPYSYYHKWHHSWYDYYAWYPWRYDYFGRSFYYNNYYFFGDEFVDGGFARGGDNARYGPRSIGTSRTDAGTRSGSSGRSTLRNRDGNSSVGNSSRSGSVTRSRGTTRVGSAGSGSSSRSRGNGSGTRSRGGNDDARVDNSGDDSQRIRYRAIPNSSRSTDARSREDADRDDRLRSVFISSPAYSVDYGNVQNQIRRQRVEPPKLDNRQRRSGGFLQRLGKFFESSRSSYGNIWNDRGGDRYGRDRDRGSSSRGSVNRSSGSDTRSRSSGSSGSRSRGSGGGDDDGNSRSRGGNN